jgi:glycosyltransferase involved in cell wall biosynthesis
MCVSVVIPSYDRPGILPFAVKSVLNQPEVVQIIIVIDGDASLYKNFILEYENNPKINIIANGKRRYSAGARNIGIENCKGKYILFIDDDIIIENGFIKQALKTMKKFGADAVGGSVLLPGQSHLNIPFFDWKTLNVKANSMHSTQVVPYTTTITLWKRWVFDKGVRFPFYKTNGYREESDLGVQALKLGCKIVYEPSCISRHNHQNYGGGQWSKGKIKWYFYSVYNNYLFLQKHYSFLKKKYSLKRGRFTVFILMALRNLSLFVPRKVKEIIKRKIYAI